MTHKSKVYTLDIQQLRTKTLSSTFLLCKSEVGVVTQTVASRQRASPALLASGNDPGVVPWLVGGSESYTGRLE
jgi:hypothetical protein